VPWRLFAERIEAQNRNSRCFLCENNGCFFVFEGIFVTGYVRYVGLTAAWQLRIAVFFRKPNNPGNFLSILNIIVPLAAHQKRIYNKTIPPTGNKNT
jgi:hypothetical protein